MGKTNQTRCIDNEKITVSERHQIEFNLDRITCKSNSELYLSVTKILKFILNKHWKPQVSSPQVLSSTYLCYKLIRFLICRVLLDYLNDRTRDVAREKTED